MTPEEELATIAEERARLAQLKREIVQPEVREIVGYRRVLTGSSCMFCAAAATKVYSRGDLAPLHAHCDCSVAPVFIGDDPGLAANAEVLRNLKAQGRRYWLKRGFVDNDGNPVDPAGPLPEPKITVNPEIGDVIDASLDFDDIADAIDEIEDASQRLSDKVSARAVDERIDELLQQNPMSNVDVLRSSIEGAFRREIDVSDLDDLDDDVAEAIVNRLDELDDQFPGVLNGTDLRGVTIRDTKWVEPDNAGEPGAAPGSWRYAEPEPQDEEWAWPALADADYRSGNIRLSRFYVQRADGVPEAWQARPLSPHTTSGGFKVVSDRTKVEATLDHEFGHFMFFRANRNYGGTTRVTPDVLLHRIDDAIAAEMKRTGVYDKDEVIRSALSGYATTDVDELMAEAFCQYVGAPEPSDLARALVAIMMEQP